MYDFSIFYFLNNFSNKSSALNLKCSTLTESILDLIDMLKESFYYLRYGFLNNLEITEKNGKIYDIISFIIFLFCCNTIKYNRYDVKFRKLKHNR